MRPARDGTSMNLVLQAGRCILRRVARYTLMRMAEALPKSPFSLTREAACGLAACAVMLASGCSSTSREELFAENGARLSESETAMPALVRAIERERRSPDRLSVSAPPPPGVPERLASPLEGAELERALLPLLQAIQSASIGVPPVPGAPATDAPGESDRLEAVRAYVIGRAQRLAGDLGEAQASLRQSVRLNAASAASWRELGLTQSAEGNRAGAASSFRRVLSIDPNDIASLEALGRAALDRDELSEAIVLLARVRSLDMASYDPALPYLVGARLSRALAGLGYFAASAEAAEDALALPEQFAQTTQFQVELASLYRQRGDLCRETGDALLRIGKEEDAIGLYERAASLPLLNPTALQSRRIWALMRQGRPAAAAAVIITDIRDSGAPPEARTLALLRHVAGHSNVGGAMSEALAALRADPALRASSSGSIVLAQAACLDDVDAALLLQDYLAESPADDAALRELFARAPADSPTALIDQTLLLIEASPMQESRYARAMIARGEDVAKLAEALDAADARPHARLLRARLLMARGDGEAADAELARLLEESPGFAPAIAARTSLLWGLGRSEEARALIDLLDPAVDPSLLDAKVLALAEIGDSAAALALLEPMLPPPGGETIDDVERMLLAARLRLGAGRDEEAATLLRAITALDPVRDEAYAGLLSLYARSGPLADDTRFLEVVRRLREQHPSSPTLRFLRAQEALSRGQLDLAEQDLLELVEEPAIRSGVVESLVRMWNGTGREDWAESWLREQIVRRPEEPVFTVELARLLIERKRGEEATSLLEARLLRHPGDTSSARLLEAILRTDPDQRERADALARSRLARSPQTPDVLVEMCEIEAGAGNIDDAAESLDRLAGARLRSDLEERLSRVAVVTASEALRGKVNMGAALRLLSGAFERLRAPGVALYLVQAQLLARSGAPVDEIIRAAGAAVSAHPSRRLELFASAYDALIKPGSAEFPGESRPKDALRLIEHACTATASPPVDLLRQWVLQTVYLDQRNQDPASLVRAVGVAQKSGTLDALAESLADILTRAQGQKPEPSDIVYGLAVFLNTQVDDREAVEALYRSAIRLDPKHIWAHNNLGYGMLEDDRNIDEAAQLIEVAYTTMMNDPNMQERAPIIDSMGWARYKQGVLRDEVDAEGKVLREGALSLLGRAYEQIAQDPNLAPALPIIADHFGDACWAAGDRVRAVELWGKSVLKADEQLMEVRQGGVKLGDETVKELERARALASEKLSAARNDQPPAIARMHAAAADPPAVPPKDPAAIIQ